MKLREEGSIIMEFDKVEIEPTYFNKLVLEFSEYYVTEIRPLKKVIIKKGVTSSRLEKYLNEMFQIIVTYSKTREMVFTKFLDKLGIKDIEGQFYKLRVKLQENNEWPKGDYLNWKYWIHGGDIEFDQLTTGQHFNVSMAMIEDLKSWSIYNHIIRSMKETEIYNFVYDQPEIVSKMFDLLVINSKLKSIRTFYGAKIYALKDTIVRSELLNPNK